MPQSTWLADLAQDFRYSLRQLREHKAFAAAVILTLALGIGANTAIFTLIDAVLLRALPVERPQQLYLFGYADGNFGGNFAQTGAWGAYSYPLYRKLKAQNRFFQDLCALQSYTSNLNVMANGNEAQQAVGKVVSGNYFSVLGVKPYLGRMLLPEDDEAGNGAVAVISYRAWKRLFHGDAALVGQSITLNGAPVTVVGITPPEFFGEKIQAKPAEFWLPLRLQSLVTLGPATLQQSEGHWLNIIGRLEPPLNTQRIEAELTGQLQQFLTAESGSKLSDEQQQLIRRCRIELKSASGGISELRDRFSEPLHLLMGLVFIVLLIACANTANLLLAHVRSRQKEIAVRLVLGVTRFRLLRQLLTESALLTGISSSAAVLFAWWGTRLLAVLLHESGKAPLLDVYPRSSTLLFTGALSVATLVLFSLLPTVQATGIDLASSLKTGIAAQRWKAGRSGLNPAQLLVIVQIAMSLVLLVSAGLLIRDFVRLTSQDLGFRREHVLVVHFDAKLAGYAIRDLGPLYKELEERVNQLPQVRSASLAKSALLSEDILGGDIFVGGYTPHPGEDMSIDINLVGQRYLETTGMTLLAGRHFEPRDAAGAPAVALINETMRRRFFPNGNPLGKKFGFGSPVEIIGVVKDARYFSPKGKIPEMAFLPLAQHLNYATDLAVRTEGDPLNVAQTVRQVIHQINNKIPILDITTLDKQVDNSLYQERLIAELAGFFGILALAVACVGLYGAVNTSVLRRTSEFGIRMAIGAQPGAVLWMVMKETLFLLVLGLTVGIAAAVFAMRLLSTRLYGLKLDDPAAVLLAVVVLCVVATCAGFIPARRAAQIDPTVALRNE
jgi:predicted permease